MKLQKLNESRHKFSAAIAVVKDDQDNFLMGVATNPGREGEWCFPGGGLLDGESPFDGAVRECFEETGIQCEPYRPIIVLPERPDVVFVPCMKTGGSISPNSEFSSVEWVPSQRIQELSPHCYRVIEEVIF